MINFIIYHVFYVKFSKFLNLKFFIHESFINYNDRIILNIILNEITNRYIITEQIITKNILNCKLKCKFHHKDR